MISEQGLEILIEEVSADNREGKLCAMNPTLVLEIISLAQKSFLFDREADWLARVCAEQMLEGVDEQSVQWWRKKARGAAEANHD